MEKGPRCLAAQRFLLTQTLARKLAPLGASVVEENGDRRLVITFKSLQELKAKRQRITSVLRRYKELIEEEPELLKAFTIDEPGALNGITRAED